MFELLDCARDNMLHTTGLNDPLCNESLIEGLWVSWFKHETKLLLQGPVQPVQSCTEVQCCLQHILVITYPGCLSCTEILRKTGRRSNEGTIAHHQSHIGCLHCQLDQGQRSAGGPKSEAPSRPVQIKPEVNKNKAAGRTTCIEGTVRRQQRSLSEDSRTSSDFIAKTHACRQRAVELFSMSRCRNSVFVSLVMTTCTLNVQRGRHSSTSFKATVCPSAERAVCMCPRLQLWGGQWWGGMQTATVVWRQRGQTGSTTEPVSSA